VEQLSSDFTNAKALQPQDRAILEYAAKLARVPEAMSKEDLVRLRSTGFYNRAILEVNLAASYVWFVNRVAEGLGFVLEADFSAFTR
jgi:alkylhydroperoxidase family enzyme